MFEKIMKPFGRGSRHAVLDLAGVDFGQFSGQTENAGEKEHDVFVQVQDIMGHPGAGGRQGHPHAVLVRDQTERRQTADGSRNGRELRPEFGGYIAHAYLAFALFEPVNRLQIILQGGGESVHSLPFAQTEENRFMDDPGGGVALLPAGNYPQVIVVTVPEGRKFLPR